MTSENNEVNEMEQEDMHGLVKHTITCPNVGDLTAYVQGKRSPNEVVILTVHDLGCNHTQYLDFVSHPRMHRITHRSVWIHVVLPGQELDAPDLPSGYVFPTMQKLGEDLVHVLDELDVKEVICFGEGAGANILTRFAIAHIQRVLGVCLLHCTGTTAGFLSSIKDKVITWKMDHIGMNPTAESYLVLHRYGTFHKAEDKEQLRTAIENYQANLRTGVNAKNLKKFCDSFLKRTNLADNIKKLTCPVLMMTGQKSFFKDTTNMLHQSLVKHCQDKGRVEFIEIQGVANIFEEKPEKLIESFQYFLQGLGVVSSVPMHHISSSKPIRMRSYSMEEADRPRLMRGLSGDSEGNSLGTSPVNMATSLPSNTPPKTDGHQPTVVKAN